MRRRVFLSYTSATTAALLAHGPAHVSKEQNAEAPRLLRVMSYNILGGRNRDESHNLRRVADVIAAARPDIVALQEVDVKTKRSRGKDILATLAEMLGMRHSFGRAIDHQGGQYGNGILSRFTIAASHTHALPGEGGEDRCALECTISVPGLDRPLSFVSLHLDNKDGGLRARQLARLHRAMAADGWSSRMLAGDFNDEPDSDLIKNLPADGWTDLAPASHRDTPTFSSDKPRIRIDFIIARAPFRHRVARYAVGAEIQRGDPGFPAELALASDHLPVLVEVSLV
jgi:endonuclease/exonuclease/phosphatase family metal-dependent hydrolase